jgi:NAD(P)-dependent dehydrogenase (short-subunit alcohol dehydrogenase family)
MVNSVGLFFMIFLLSGVVDTHEEVYRHTQALGVSVDLHGPGRSHACLCPCDDREKRRGIINVSSIAAFQPMPYQAVYGASKAFVLSLSLALWALYRRQGVRVVALCPGPTATNFLLHCANGEQKEPVHTKENMLCQLKRTKP